MKKRIIIAAALIVIGFFVAQYLLGQTGEDSFPAWYIAIMMYVAILLPPIGLVVWGRNGFFVGALVACLYNLFDLLFLKSALKDYMPNTLTSVPNLFGVGPINFVYFVASVITLKRGRLMVISVAALIIVVIGIGAYLLKNRPTVENTSPVNTIQTTDWKSNTQFSGFAKIAAFLKKQNPSVPILLPTELQGITLKSQYGEEVYLYAAALVSNDGGYVVSLYYGENCGGANACFGASFTAEKGKRMTTEGTEEVALADGIMGYYYPRSCGGSCSPQGILWVYKGVNYFIQLKTNNEKAVLISWANSAIQNASDR